MTEIPAEVEQVVSAMDEATFTAWAARVRGAEESADPMERAAAALRRSRGVDRRRKATKQEAADALHRYANGTREN